MEKRKPGRPVNPETPRRLAMAKHFGVKHTHRGRRTKLTVALMNQVDSCADEAARRIILGVSR
jgi:hypothetical protein